MDQNLFIIPFIHVGYVSCSLAHFVTAIEYMYFYPHDAMLARVIVIATCPSVCLFVCLSVRPSVRHAPVLCQNEEI